MPPRIIRKYPIAKIKNSWRLCGPILLLAISSACVTKPTHSKARLSSRQSGDSIELSANYIQLARHWNRSADKVKIDFQNASYLRILNEQGRAEITIGDGPYYGMIELERLGENSTRLTTYAWGSLAKNIHEWRDELIRYSRQLSHEQENSERPEKSSSYTRPVPTTITAQPKPKPRIVPIVPGCSIGVIYENPNDPENLAYAPSYKLTNGDGIKHEDLLLIRELCELHDNDPKLAELLVRCDIAKDDIDRYYFIFPKDYGLSTFSPYISLKSYGQGLRVRIQYTGDDWLFVQSYKVAADDYRWQSPESDFERDHSAGTVWEWLDVPATQGKIEIAKRLANSEKSVIRFQGSQYNFDRTLTKAHKQSINTILSVFNLLEQ